MQLAELALLWLITVDEWSAVVAVRLASVKLYLGLLYRILALCIEHTAHTEVD